MSVGFLITAILKPIFPDNVGLWLHEGVSLGTQFPAPAGVKPLGGYWIIPICLVLGISLLTFVHRLARNWIARLRERRLVRIGSAGASRVR